MNKRRTGGEKETLAAEYLKKKGFSILEMNYRNRKGEVDIIALDGDVLVFVEVKFRSSDRSGNPLEAVDFRKQRKIAGVCDYFLLMHPQVNYEQVRFDVVGILGDEITHVENAFPYPF